MDDERFELQGVTYYRQGRKCGKPGCRCTTGDLHGPYWWRRDHAGKVTYLGTRLPPDVAAARAIHNTLRPTMEAERRELVRRSDDLLRQAYALGRLIDNRLLDPGDLVIIEALGFGAALVQPSGPPVTQEAGRELVRPGSCIGTQEEAAND
jgi:hypothetical protein